MRPSRCYEFVRNVFIPTAALVAEKGKSASNPSDCVCKPSELPIYAAEVNRHQQVEVCQAEEPGVIENAFGTVRRTIFSLMGEIKNMQQIGEDYVNIGVDNAQGLINYLQEEDNTTPKYGAVALGGLAGLILGLRGGLFKRTLYTSAGALGMAAVCYPKEAAEYSQIGIAEAKHYATIAYNFIHGDGSNDKCDPHHEGHEVNEDIDIDPLCVISEAHATAANKSCHCPIGACMGHHEESHPDPESEEQAVCGAEKS